MRIITTVIMVIALSMRIAAQDIAVSSAPSSKSTSSIAVSTTPSSKSMPLVSMKGVATSIVVDPADREVVTTAANCVAADIKLVTGKQPTVSNTLKGLSTAIIAGTIGQSSFIDQLAASGKIDISDLEGKWESYALQMVKKPVKGMDRALVIIGSTPRGTAYGLFELSRLMGVSPLVYWADVAPEHRNALYVTGKRTLVGEPSVKFRGIFINDEDWGLFPWAKQGIDKKYNNIGPGTYAKVMELLLRLRANILWPAMHPCSEAFWANKDNLPIARRYDIVLGSSHCEQMLRNNVWEWQRHDGNSGTNDNWNYATNRSQVQRYWAERVGESRGIDAMYTLGMRGVHDSGIAGYRTTEDKVRGLTEIITYQRQLLADSIGDISAIPQVFIPYKEVLDAYNAGLQVPDDVTLCWVDDNFSYVRQLPLPAEQARSGGNGLYYHISYWGRPVDYLWLCATAPALVSYELAKAYANNVRDLWIINVGDIKPAEAETEFCMDLAWDVNRWGPENAHTYMRQWAARTFGEEHAEEIAAIKEQYYHLASNGKPDHVHAIAYSNEERNQRIEEYRQLMERTDALKTNLPPRLHDAFYQLLEYPVKGCYFMNVKQFRAAQSLEAAKAGNREKALACAAESKAAFEMILQLTDIYNNQIAGGEWKGMMDYNPRNQAHYKMPKVAADEDVAAERTAEQRSPERIVVGAESYTDSQGGFVTIQGLGTGKSAVAVWPLDTTAYPARSAADIAKAPFVEYEVPVRTGLNHITARFLPTFPLNTSYDLRVAISIDGREAQVISLRTSAGSNKWKTNVLVGYTDAQLDYSATADRTVKVRISALDPAVVVCDICNTLPDSPSALSAGSGKQSEPVQATMQSAKNLFAYLQSIRGRKTLSATMANVAWNTDEAEMVHKATGRYPAIATFDYIHLAWSPADWIDYSDTRGAEEWWKAGGIVSACWHWNVPCTEADITSQRNMTYTPGDGRRNAEGQLTTAFRPENIFVEGSWEKRFADESLRKMADMLLLLQAKGIPVIWRPLHEAGGNTYADWNPEHRPMAWFWWGRDGAETYKRLWRYMFDYFGSRGLTNLIWVFTGDTRDMAFYPGDKYVDIVGCDIYHQRSEQKLTEQFNGMSAIYPSKLVTLSEMGDVADIAAQWNAGARWLYFNPWYHYAAKSLDGHSHADTRWWRDAMSQPFVVGREQLPRF